MQGLSVMADPERPPRVQYVEPEQIAARIEANSTDFTVIDVRDELEVFESGRVGAIQWKNLPSYRWSESRFVDSVLKENLHVPEIVVHCQKSQVRGPTCASLLSQAVERLVETGGDASKIPKM